MPQTKRVRREPEEARKLILNATQKLMIEDGYASVSTRRVATLAGVNVALVHYYYPTTDDLFIALHERLADDQIAELKTISTAADPLLAIWRFESTWPLAPLGIEFVALANHRKSISDRVRQRAEEVRSIEVAAIAALLGRSGLDARSLTTLMVGVARALLNEESLGMTTGHAEVRSLVERVLGDLPSVDRFLVQRPG